MPDMLVRLYKLPPLAPVIDALGAAGIQIRRAGAWEKHILSDWVQTHFGTGWAVATEIALEQRPVSCYIAVQVDQRSPADRPSELLLGFAIYDVAAKGMFGPIGVREDYRGRGIGQALLLTCLHAMYADGYAYAIIGQIGPAKFYEKTVGATLIADSDPGVARRNLHG